MAEDIINLSTECLPVNQMNHEKPQPDVADERYGIYERNVLDLWQARSDKPTPLVIYIHAGGFLQGDKNEADTQLIASCLESGISFASINYRLTDVAPYPAQMLDGARAVQYLRYKAKEFNLDPRRFACTGGSAGAGISLWLAFHKELADAGSSDPVLCESTRITCALGTDAQCSYDPRWIQMNIGGLAYQNKALPRLFSVSADELLSDKAAKLYEDASSINHLAKDAPPVKVIYFCNDEPNDKDPGVGIHSRKFGMILQSEMEKMGLSCEFSAGNSPEIEDQMRFFIRHLKSEQSPG